MQNPKTNPNHNNNGNSAQPIWKLRVLFKLLREGKLEWNLISSFLLSRNQESVIQTVETALALKEEAENGNAEAFGELLLVTIASVNYLESVTRKRPDLAKQFAPSLPTWPSPYFQNESLNTRNRELVDSIGLGRELRITRKILDLVDTRKGYMVVLLHLAERIRRMSLRQRSNIAARQQAAQYGASHLPGSKPYSKTLQQRVHEDFNRTVTNEEAWFLQDQPDHISRYRKMRGFWASVWKLLNSMRPK